MPYKDLLPRREAPWCRLEELAGRTRHENAFIKVGIGFCWGGGGGRKGRPHALSFSISRLFVTLSHFLSLSLLLPAAAS